ncbi:MAG: polysaccharide export protein, partial [Candidatus Omnitrophica bacterium]|nr:polysaccharide export protein [Candidatus Omnitrophota bacterium]
MAFYKIVKEKSVYIKRISVIILFITSFIFSLKAADLKPAEEVKPVENNPVVKETLINRPSISPNSAVNDTDSNETTASQPSVVDILYGVRTPSFNISKLKQFGYDILKVSSSFSEIMLTGASISEYILGYGDTIIIDITGKISEHYEFEIDKEGKVSIPNIGAIYLWGKTFAEASNSIKSEFDKRYANIQTEVKLGKMRDITISVMGEVERPGAYSLTSLSTILHALYLTGGPTRSGSFRNIRLIRENKVKSTIDLYDYFMKGDLSFNERLVSGDTIFVPLIGEVAAVAGNVKRPGIYELKSQTKLLELIELAGGFITTAYIQQIHVDRVEKFNRRVVLNLRFENADDDNKGEENNILLRDGDYVR